MSSQDGTASEAGGPTIGVLDAQLEFKSAMQSFFDSVDAAVDFQGLSKNFFHYLSRLPSETDSRHVELAPNGDPKLPPFAVNDDIASRLCSKIIAKDVMTLDVKKHMAAIEEKLCSLRMEMDEVIKANFDETENLGDIFGMHQRRTKGSKEWIGAYGQRMLGIHDQLTDSLDFKQRGYENCSLIEKEINELALKPMNANNLEKRETLLEWCRSIRDTLTGVTRYKNLCIDMCIKVYKCDLNLFLDKKELPVSIEVPFSDEIEKLTLTFKSKLLSLQTKRMRSIWRGENGEKYYRTAKTFIEVAQSKLEHFRTTTTEIVANYKRIQVALAVTNITTKQLSECAQVMENATKAELRAYDFIDHSMGPDSVFAQCSSRPPRELMEVPVFPEEEFWKLLKMNDQ